MQWAQNIEEYKANFWYEMSTTHWTVQGMFMVGNENYTVKSEGTIMERHENYTVKYIRYIMVRNEQIHCVQCKVDLWYEISTLQWRVQGTFTVRNEYKTVKNAKVYLW